MRDPRECEAGWGAVTGRGRVLLLQPIWFLVPLAGGRRAMACPNPRVSPTAPALREHDIIKYQTAANGSTAKEWFTKRNCKSRAAT